MFYEHLVSTLSVVLTIQKYYLYLIAFSFLVEKTEMFKFFWFGFLRKKKNKDDADKDALLDSLIYGLFNLAVILLCFLAKKLPENFSLIIWLILTIGLAYFYYKVYLLFQLKFRIKKKRRKKKMG